MAEKHASGKKLVACRRRIAFSERIISFRVCFTFSEVLLLDKRLEFTIVVGDNTLQCWNRFIAIKIGKKKKPNVISN